MVNNGSINAIQSVYSITTYDVATEHAMAKSINKAANETKFLNFQIVFDKTTYGGLWRKYNN